MSVTAGRFRDDLSTHHHWVDDGWIPAAKTPSGHAEHERHCSCCALVKITVLPPDGIAYRVWRMNDARWEGVNRPPCRENNVVSA